MINEIQYLKTDNKIYNGSKKVLTDHLILIVLKIGELFKKLKKQKNNIFKFP